MVLITIYNYSIHGVYKATFTSLGGPHIVGNYSIHGTYGIRFCRWSRTQTKCLSYNMTSGDFCIQYYDTVIPYANHWFV